MVTRTFLVGVLIGVLLTTVAFTVREEFQSLDRRIHRVEKLFDLIVPQAATPEPEKERGLSYGAPQQEAL